MFFFFLQLADSTAPIQRGMEGGLGGKGKRKDRGNTYADALEHAHEAREVGDAAAERGYGGLEEGQRGPQRGYAVAVRGAARCCYGGRH